MRSRNWTLVFSVVGLLGFAPLGCDSDGGSGEPAVDEYTEALPDQQMLMMSLTEDEAQQQALTEGIYQAALVNDPSQIQARAQEIADRVNAAVEETQAIIDANIEGVTPTETTVGRFLCRVWEKDIDANHWRLAVCERDLAAKRYFFSLYGWPLTGTEADKMLVLAGEGRILPRFDGKRRGAGRIGYNFDNWNALTGQGPTGKAAIGYRAAGRLRQLHVGLRDLLPEGQTTPRSALYRFAHVIGKGGHLRFVVDDDVVKPEGNGFVMGEDGIIELARAGLDWARGIGARATARVCGGSVGEGQCVFVRQCWKADNRVTFEDLRAVLTGEEASPWDPAACPADDALPLPPSEVPTEEDTTVPEDSTGEVPGPAVDEPAEMTDIENAPVE